MSYGGFTFHYIPVLLSVVGLQEHVFSAVVLKSCICVSVSVLLLCVSAWVILLCVYPQCVCSLGHGTSAYMSSILLREGGVLVVGLSIFHVLLACLFPPSNSLRGEKNYKKKRTQDSFFTFALSPLEALFISLLSLSLVRHPYSRIVFLESKGRFVLCCFAA